MRNASVSWARRIIDGSAVSRLNSVLIGLFLLGLFVRFMMLVLAPDRMVAQEWIQFTFSWVQMPLNWQEFIWRLYTPMVSLFIHFQPFDFIFSMIGLYFIGNHFQYFMGDRRVLPFFLWSGIFGNMVALGFAQIPMALTEGMGASPLSGASPAIIGMLAASVLLYPDMPVSIPIFGRVKVQNLLIAQMILLLFLLVVVQDIGSVVAQMGGMGFGFLYAWQFKKGRDWMRLGRRKGRKSGTEQEQMRRIQVKMMHGRALQDDEYNFLRKEREATLDELLDKISAKGMGSLSKEEKALLDRYSKQ